MTKNTAARTAASEAPTPQGKRLAAADLAALRPVGVLLADGTGNFFLKVGAGNIFRVSAQIESKGAQAPAVNKSGGRPNKTLRNVALTLHFEYLNGIAGMPIGWAQKEAARLFHLKDPDNVRAIVKKTLADVLHGFTHRLASDGLSADAHGIVPKRVLAWLRGREDGTVEGYAVNWGWQEANFGRGVLTFTPNGFDLELN